MDTDQVPFVTQVKLEDSNQQIQKEKAEPETTEATRGNERDVKQDEDEVQIVFSNMDVNKSQSCITSNEDWLKTEADPVKSEEEDWAEFREWAEGDHVTVVKKEEVEQAQLEDEEVYEAMSGKVFLFNIPVWVCVLWSERSTRI